jgi:hypothetical protein
MRRGVMRGSQLDAGRHNLVYEWLAEREHPLRVWLPLVATGRLGMKLILRPMRRRRPPDTLA